MLECKLCDYYSAGEKKTAKCLFTGVIFSGDVENIDMEYPCRGVRYDEYLQRQNADNESQKQVNAYSFKNDDWRFIYKRGHAADAKDKNNNRAI